MMNKGGIEEPDEGDDLDDVGNKRLHHLNTKISSFLLNNKTERLRRR